MNTAFSDAGAAAFMDWLADGDGDGRDWSAEVLENPGGERPVVGYACHATTSEGMAGGLRRVVAKTYGDDLGATAFAAMTTLHAAVAAAGATTLRIPRPLRYDAQRRCLLQERAAGCSLGTLLGSAELPQAMSVAGRALAELHGLAVDGSRAKTLAEHIGELMRPHPEDLALAFPEYRLRIEAILAALARALPNDVPPVPLHRDFHPRQIFIDGGHGWIIDWDLYAHGDPALDVGNFLMSMRLKRLPAVAAAAFLHGYAQVRDDPQMRRRVWAYGALNYLRRACKHWRLRHADAPRLIAGMLAAAEDEIQLNRAQGGKA